MCFHIMLYTPWKERADKPRETETNKEERLPQDNGEHIEKKENGKKISLLATKRKNAIQWADKGQKKKNEKKELTKRQKKRY